MAKAAPAKHKIRVASHSLSRRVACLPVHNLRQVLCKTQTELFNGAAKMTKMRCQQMDRRTNGTVKAPLPFYLQQHCHFRPPFVRRHPHLLTYCAPFLTFLSFLQQERVPKESQKLQIDGDWRTFKTLSLLS